MGVRTRRWIGAVVLASISVAGLLAAGSGGAGAASSNSFTVKAGEYAYKLSGKPAPGWVTVNFQNGGVEYHMMAVLKLKSGVTVKQIKDALTASDQDKAFAKIVQGDPSTYGMPELLAPGESIATVTQMSSGHYGILCFVPAAGDGKEHALHGMIATIDVSGAKSSAVPPKDGVQDVALTDSAITIPTTGITAHATLKVTNNGTNAHTFTLVKLEAGKTLNDAYNYFNTFFETGKATGTAPGTVVGGVSDVKPGGGVAYVELDLKPGHYGYLSTDGDSPNDDYAKGMRGETDIK